ncbi:RES domain-containing protein [Flavitalea sp. BT771]|uniref:RES domain-containing protein n=1 Tax=Flavitalea sp. BT771 TaxID=3063329 RepID=UPI0026E24669|nr:RES domain-containing protein [Flavitalea sp. BT771]MDO6435755.1 RES domain-containing protein [Flavitalea sp. BT771]MDV6224656.1 RES domain-containing protein [Flavitalea sp. BT771]
MAIVPLAELQQRIQTLDVIDNALDKAAVWQKYLAENGKLTFDGNTPLFAFHPKSPMPVKGQRLFRVTGDWAIPYEHLASTYQHPPEAIASRQRCNLPKHPAFYCGDVWSISFFEVLQDKDHLFDTTYYFSHWEVQLDRTWRALSFLFSGLPPENPMYGYVQQNTTVVINYFKQFLPAAEVKHYLDFYHSEFTKTGSHTFSSLVSHQFLYNDDPQSGDFVFYPSVQAEHLGNNFAFNPKLIAAGEIALVKVYKIKIHELKKTSDVAFTWRYELLNIGDANVDNVIWRGPTDADIQEFEHHFPASKT